MQIKNSLKNQALVDQFKKDGYIFLENAKVQK